MYLAFVLTRPDIFPSTDVGLLRGISKNYKVNYPPNKKFLNKISNCGITNFNLDFIFGVNQESLDEWEDELNYLEEIDIKHVSTYCLTIEESTPFWKLHERGEIIKVSEDIFLDMASLTKRK